MTDNLDAWSFGEGDALREIVAWIEGRPAWQQQALRWLLDTDQLDEAQLGELLAMALERRNASNPVQSRELRMAGAANQTVALCSIDCVANVNALAPDQRLTFGATGLTVIYGRNGAGKSGYARILKHACRARLPRKKEAILPSIDDSRPGAPAARIKCAINGMNRYIHWTEGREVDEAMSAISVFDSSTAPIHVDEVNEVAYTPYPLELLERLASTSLALKDLVTRAKQSIENRTPELLRAPPTNTSTSVGKLLASLSGQTTEAAIRQLAGLEAVERVRLDALRRDFAGDPRQAAQELRAVRSELLGAKMKIEQLANATSQEAAGALCDAQRQQVESRQAADLAAARDFATEPLPATGSQAWRALWEAARRYATEDAYPDRYFPATDEADRCVLCHQVLDAAAADRLRRFEAFVRDETEAKAAESAKRYLSLRSHLAESLPTAAFSSRLRALLGQVGAEGSGRTIVGCLTRLRWHGRRILREHSIDTPKSAAIDIAGASIELRRLSADLETRANALVSEAGSPDRERLEAEIRELSDRQWPGSALEDVIAEIGRRRELANHVRVERECATNAITQKATELTEYLVTGKLRRQFQSEIVALGVDYADVELQRQSSRTGVPRFQVKFIRRDDVPAGRVLSEGESQAVALAAFLSELATARGKSGIIFDDPVSSLDEEHRTEIAKRLVAEAQNRQVIVFTHDLAFLLLLDRTAVEQHQPSPQYRSITRGSGGPGICSLQGPHNTRAIIDVLSGIERDLNNKEFIWKTGDEHRWRIEIRSFAEQLRECWERAVEDFVGPVFRRMSTKVSTDGLVQLTSLTESGCDRMRQGYGWCSTLLHSTPSVINPKLPTPAMVQAQIHEIREWYSQWCEGRGR